MSAKLFQEATTKKITLILVGVLAFGLLLASIGIGTRAYFSDIETATGNTFVAATWNNPFDIYEVSGDGEWEDNNWLVSMYANEEKSTTVTFANYSADDITVTLTASPASHDEGNLIFGFDNSTLVILAKGKASVVFWVETTQSVTPGTYSTTVTVELSLS